MQNDRFTEQARALVAQMTLEERASMLRYDAPRHPAAGHSRVQLVERGAARRGARRHRHGLPAGDRHGGVV